MLKPFQYAEAVDERRAVAIEKAVVVFMVEFGEGEINEDNLCMKK